MSIEKKNLIDSPAVFVVGQTSFNLTGLQGWVVFNELDKADSYIGSPLQHIVDGDNLVSEQHAHGELMAEFAGRFCYNSFLKGRESDEYLANVIEMRHGSVLEHVTLNLAIQGVSRSLTHELIRHRAGFAVSQESQRYVDAKDMKWVVPPILLDIAKGDLDHPLIQSFMIGCERDLGDYVELQTGIFEALMAERAANALPDGVKVRTMMKKRANEAARSRLPNASETKLTWTGNLRALRHFCELRGDEFADLEIRRLATVIAETVMDVAPYTFHDMKTHDGSHNVGTVSVEHTKV
jgi:thymidylate synthase (FAD)